MKWLWFGTVIKLDLDCFTDCFSNDDDDEIKLSSNRRFLLQCHIVFKMSGCQT